MAPNGRLMGLDYPAVAVVAAALDIDMDDGMLRMIQAIEQYEMGIGGDAGKPPACHNVEACRMCRKQCAFRMAV